MRIPYRPVHFLISKYFLLTSLDGIIKDCSVSFDDSIKTAKELEDFEYLKVLITDREEVNAKYDIWWDYRHKLPTLLERDVDFTIEGLSKLAFDTIKSIPKVEFETLIESICDNEKIDPQAQLEKFNTYYNLRVNYYKLEYEKIQRNQICPCGSGKKYKNCHGK